MSDSPRLPVTPPSSDAASVKTVGGPESTSKPALINYLPAGKSGSSHRILFVAVATILLIPLIIIVVSVYGLAFTAAYLLAGGPQWMVVGFLIVAAVLSLLPALIGFARGSRQADDDSPRPARPFWRPRMLIVITVLFGAGMLLSIIPGMQDGAVGITGLWFEPHGDALFVQAIRHGSPVAQSGAVHQLSRYVRPGDRQAAKELQAWLGKKRQSAGITQYEAENAIQALGRIGPAAAPAAGVVLAITKDIPSVEYSTRTTLQNMGPGILPTLIETIGSQNDNQRRIAAEVLRSLGPAAESAAPALVAAIDNPHTPWNVVQPAAYALARIHAPASMAVPAIILCGQQRGSDMSLQEALAAYGPDAVKPLMDLATGKNSDDRFFAVGGLAQLGAVGPGLASKVVPELIIALGRSEPEAKQEAALVLKCYGAQAAPATDALASALKDPIEEVRTTAAQALAAIGPAAKSASPALKAVMENKGQAAAFRIECAAALGAIDPADPTAAAVLRDLLQHSSENDQTAAATNLGHFSPTPSNVEALTLVISGAAATTVPSEPAANPAPSTAIAAAKSLAGYSAGAGAAVPALVKWAAVAKGDELLAATGALIKIAPNSPQTIDAILRGLSDPAEGTRYETIEFVGTAAGALKFDGPNGARRRAELRKAITSAIDGFSGWSKLNGITSYAQFDAPAATSLFVDLLKSPPAGASKDDVLFCLGHLGPAGASAGPALKAGIANHTLPAYKAGDALWKTSGDLSGLTAALNGPDDSMAADFLGNLGVRAAPVVPALIATARHGSEGFWAKMALEKIDPAAAAGVDRPMEIVFGIVVAAYVLVLLALFLWWRHIRRTRRVYQG